MSKKILLLVFLMCINIAAAQIIVQKNAPEVIQSGDVLNVTINITNNFIQSKYVIIKEDISLADPVDPASFNYFEAPLGVYASATPYYEWELSIDPAQEIQINYSIIPKIIGAYMIGATEASTTDGNFYSDTLSVKVLCNNNSVCETLENYDNCPNDCIPGSADGFCDWVNDSICDFDCDPNYDIDCWQEFNITFSEGWNLLSFPLALLEDELPVAFDLFNTKYSVFLDYDTSSETWNHFNPFTPYELSNLKTIDPKKGYWLYTKSPFNVSIGFDLANTTKTFRGYELRNKTLALSQGWNIVGYPSVIEQNISVVFADIISNVKSVYAWENNTWLGYVPDGNPDQNTLELIKPGLGYWVNVNQSTSLVIS